MTGGMILGRPLQIFIGGDALQCPRRFKLSPQQTVNSTISNSKKNVDLLVVEQVTEAVEQAEENCHLLEAADEASDKRKIKKAWTGPIRPRKRPPYPPWTDAECKEKQKQILGELLVAEAEGTMQLSLVLEAWVGKVTRVDIGNVMRELEGLRKQSLVVEVFNWMRQRCGRLNPKAHICNLVLGILGRAGMLSDAEEVFLYIKQQDWDKLRAYNAMIAAYYKAGRPGDAFDTFKRMEAEGVRANEVTFNTLLAGSGESKVRVRSILKQMKARGLKPNLRSYNAAIRVLNVGGNLNRLEKTIARMTTDGVQPDLYSFNNLIDAYSKAREPKKGLEVLRSMKAAGVEPDLVTYTTLIQMFSRSFMHKEAINVYNSMQERRCKPDLFTYSLVISVYGKAGLVANAARVFRILQHEGYKPNLVTWTSLVGAYLQQQLFRESMELFTQMERHGIKGDVHLYNLVIGSCARAGWVAEAVQVFHRMRAQEIAANRDSYGILVEAFLSCGLVAQADSFYNSMVEAGITDSRLSFKLAGARKGMQY